MRGTPVNHKPGGNMFPEHKNIETPLGPADQVWATSETHIGMSGTFTINRVAYRVRLDLHLRDGEWQCGDKDDWSAKYHALLIDREWSYPGGKPRPETSTSARTKAADALIPWLAEYAVTDGAEIVHQAGAEDRARKIESARGKIEKLRAEIEQAERELAEQEK